MKKNVFKRCAAAVAACTIMASAMPALPFATFAEGNNIIKNSTFDTNTNGWGLYKESGGICSLGVEDGKLAFTVKDRGTLNYACQLNYDIIPLYQNGVYRLSFDISSSVDRYVEAMIQLNGGDYHSYCWKGIDVTSEAQNVVIDFTMEDETDIMAKMCFNCGVEKGDPEDMPEHVIYLDNVVLELVDDSNVDYSETQGYEAQIITNQVGFKPDAKKTAVFRKTEGGSFSVVNADTKKVVFTGAMEGPKTNISADETNFTGDFSEVKEPGTYYITSEGLDDSYPFEIGEGVYDNLLDASVRMLYLQRCGTAVQDSVFGHAACHDSMATVYGTDTKIDVTGGWHDAGDYGRYTVAAAKAVADLMYAYLANPSIFSDSIDIPESGNGVADILDEVKYELQWMLKMQDKNDGGVYHKVSCAQFPGNLVMPEDETKPLIVMPKATPATADFAASMALAAEVYKTIDPDFAAECLAAAKSAYAWAKENPSVFYKNPLDIGTGEYGDSKATDELYWAAAQLYRATGDESYIDGVAAKTGMDWATVGDYGNIAILTMDGVDKESTAYKNASAAVLKQAKDLKSISEAKPYGETLIEYYWGSNMGVANSGVILAIAADLTGDSSYMDAANAQLNYLLGTNANGASFVSGFGTVRPEHPHHRPSMAKDQAMPGMVAGGVNESLEDSAAKAYCANSAPAKCWVDDSGSYSTNEITIYWNSPFTYLLAVSDAAENSAPGPIITPDDDVLWGDANCDGKVTIADATAILQHLGNQDKYALSAEGLKNADVNNSGDGITGQDALAIQKLDAGIINSLPESVMAVPAETTTTKKLNETTVTTTTTTAATVVTPSNNIKDYGTEINANATMKSEFYKNDAGDFFASDGWTNGSCFDCGWTKNNAYVKDGCLTLTIDKDTTGRYNYTGGEFRTNDFYSYGYFETSMQAIKNDGVVSSFFTYTGESDNNPWDEIDIEVLGKDTTKVQLNYYTNGVGNHEYMYDLGFDASEGYHTYGFDWQPDHITWYVDGKPVHTAYDNLPKTPGKIMMNAWPGITVDEWLKPFNGKTPLSAHYQWVTYDKK